MARRSDPSISEHQYHFAGQVQPVFALRSNGSSREAARRRTESLGTRATLYPSVTHAWNDRGRRDPSRVPQAAGRGAYAAAAFAAHKVAYLMVVKGRLARPEMR